MFVGGLTLIFGNAQKSKHDPFSMEKASMFAIFRGNLLDLCKNRRLAKFWKGNTKCSFREKYKVIVCRQCNCHKGFCLSSLCTQAVLQYRSLHSYNGVGGFVWELCWCWGQWWEEGGEWSRLLVSPPVLSLGAVTRTKEGEMQPNAELNIRHLIFIHESVEVMV